MTMIDGAPTVSEFAAYDPQMYGGEALQQLPVPELNITSLSLPLRLGSVASEVAGNGHIPAQAGSSDYGNSCGGASC
jgi:hypothetical protein